MECKGLGADLSAYLDGELAPRRQRLLAEHLAGCRACRARLDWLATSREAFREVSPASPRSGFETRLDERLRQERTPRRARPKTTPVWRLAAVAAALVAILGVALAGRLPRLFPEAPETSGQPPVTSTAQAPASEASERLGREMLQDLPPWLACRVDDSGRSCRPQAACRSPAECGATTPAASGF